MKISACFSVVFLFLCLEPVRSADIILKKNGYENVLVAIGASVDEDPEIIKGIKAIFTNGSRYLYRATRYRAYFRKVTILVPAKWRTKREYKSASNNETCDKAALLVDVPKREVGNQPFAQPVSPNCGDQFKYIHLTPKFVTDSEFARSNYGPPGKVLVHEWAHFRWGVFDEHPLPGEKHHYRDEDFPQPVACTSSIRDGQYFDIRTNKTYCQFKNGDLDEYCRFIPSPSQPTNASYMYNQSIVNIEDFCDNGTFDDGRITHNKRAPTKQNAMCKTSSVWEVMWRSVDFKHDNAENADRFLDTTPSFKLIQRSVTQKVVLLIDVSGSMHGNPITMMRQEATKFIKNIIRTGSYIGIVTFNTEANTKLNVKRIRNETDRNEAKYTLPKIANGGTHIGVGMEKAIKVLTSTDDGKDWARGASVILMSDGENTGGPSPLSMIPPANDLGITFHTIGYGNGADEILSTIASRTGGRHFFSTKSDTSSGLLNAFSGFSDSLYNVEGGCSDSTSPASVKSSADVVKGLKNISGEFAIDFTIGKDTIIMFSYLSQYAFVEIHLVAPDGSVIDKNDKVNYKVDRDTQIIQITIPGIALKGMWKYTISSSDTTVVLVNVLSRAVGDGEDAEPIRLNARFGGASFTLGSGPEAQTSIYAMVSRGYTPVIGLDVKAVIEGRTNKGLKIINVDLKDNGIGADLEVNDGIYSAVIGRFVVNVEGRYSITIKVDNPQNKAKIPEDLSVVEPGAARIGTEPTKPVASYKTVGPIQRVAAAGELRVEHPLYPTPVDVIPPPRIRDLQFVLIDIKNVKVTLKWTAVGDDVSHGKNTAYDLRLGTFEEVNGDFENSARIYLPGTPRNAGEVEEHTIDMAAYSKTVTYFFAIRAIDEAGNKADPSNIISLSMTLPTKFSNGDPIAATDQSPKMSAPEDPATESPGLSNPVTQSVNLMVILVCAGVGAVIVMSVIVGVVCYYRKKKKTPPAEQPLDVIDAEQGGSALSPPQADCVAQHMQDCGTAPYSPQAEYSAEAAAVHNVGQKRIITPAQYPAYDNIGFNSVSQLVKQFEAL